MISKKIWPKFEKIYIISKIISDTPKSAPKPKEGSEHGEINGKDYLYVNKHAMN